MRSTLLPHEETAIRLTDEELIPATWDAFMRISNADADEALDEFAFFVQEILERWAPEAEWNYAQRRIRADEHERIVNDALIDAYRERQQRQAARILWREVG
jgi:hypothetical protein